jgi:hypothetical protein
MADIDNVKRNIQRMIDQGAPEADIDSYVASEGLTADQLRAHKPGKSIGGFVNNIRTDAWNTASGIAGGLYSAGRKIVTDPVGAAGDVAQGVDTAGAVMSGALGHAYNDTLNMPILAFNGKEIIPAIGKGLAMTPGDDMKLASKVRAVLKDRYWDNLGDTLYNEPVQSGLDAATLLAGGAGVARTGLGATSKVTKGLETAAKYTNPFTPAAKPLTALRDALVERREMRKIQRAAPTHAQAQKATDDFYEDLRSRGIAIPADEFKAINDRFAEGPIILSEAGSAQSVAQRMASTQAKNQSELAVVLKSARDQQARSEGILREYKATSQPDTFEVENEVQEAALAVRKAEEAVKAGKPVDFDRLEDYRRSANSIANDNSPGMTETERSAARQIVKAIDDALAKTPQADDIKAAREMAERNIKARQIAEMDRKSYWYTSGDESGTRNQMSNYRKANPNAFTPVEEKIAEQIVHREGVHGLLNTNGSKLAQIAALIVGGTKGVGLLPMTGGWALSMAARAGSAAMTNAARERLVKTILAGRKAQEEARKASMRVPYRGTTALIGSQGITHSSGRPTP